MILPSLISTGANSSSLLEKDKMMRKRIRMLLLLFFLILIYLYTHTSYSSFAVLSRLPHWSSYTLIVLVYILSLSLSLPRFTLLRIHIQVFYDDVPVHASLLSYYHHYYYSSLLVHHAFGETKKRRK